MLVLLFFFFCYLSEVYLSISYFLQLFPDLYSEIVWLPDEA